ncbi:MAG: 3-deoxy-D-manno-octulosonic acid transferase [Alphaproteobacteria bacterium]
MYTAEFREKCSHFSWLFVSLILETVWWLTLWVRLQKGKENPQRVREKWAAPSVPRPAGRLIWIHGASIGESRAALGLIQKLLAADPGLSILVTTVTKDSATLMRTSLPGRAFHQMLPLDAPRVVQRFLDYWKPERAFFIESDFWPFLLREVRRRKIPAFLLNGRVSEQSFRRWLWVPLLSRSLLSTFKACLTPSQTQAQRLRRLGAKTVQVTGNLKLTLPPLPVDESLVASLKTACLGRRLWLASNTHEGEEALLLKLHAELLKSFPELLLFLCPRHISRREELELLLQQQGLAYQRLSLWLQNPRSFGAVQVVMGDTLGNVGELYALHDLVVMGGSFLPKIGGHNLVEPAQQGCCIVHGPFMEHNLEISQTFQEAQAAVQLPPEELLKTVGDFLSNPETQRPYQQRGRQLLTSCEKILDDILDIIQA